VLVFALVLMSVMASVALASYAIADTGQLNSSAQRQRETSLNVAEGLLHSQGFALAQDWPGNAGLGPGMPVGCDQTSTSALCPIAATLAAAHAPSAAAANFTNVDARAAVSWTTKVRDNGGALAASYSPASADTAQSGIDKRSGGAYVCAAPCRWDANGDHQMWVDARAVVQRRARDLVALMKLETVLEATSEAAVTAGGINIDNNGNKIMVYAQGSQVVVRCPLPSLGCVLTKLGQIQPSPVSVNVPPLMTATQLARFKRRAITDGTYFAGCPGDEISGAVVWVENCATAQLSSSIVTQPCVPAAPPSPGGGGTALPQNCVNQHHRPGILIWHCGRMSISGGWTYVGVVYAVNGSDGTCPASAPPAGDGNCSGNNNNTHNVVSLTGGGGVWGALSIDGQGCLYAGSNGIQVQFDANVFGAVASYGTVGLVQNTWRELTAGSGPVS
jgi:hypothetical protein